MPMMPVHLELDEELRQRVIGALVERINTAVTAADERDYDLEMYDAQLEGDLDTGDNGPWKGSCRLHDPLTRELHIQAMAQSVQGLQRYPIVQVDAATDEEDDDQRAQRLESWIAGKMQTEQLPRTIYELEYNRYRDPTAVLYCGWRQDLERTYTSRYWDGRSLDRETGEKVTVPEAQVPEGAAWQEVPFEETRRTYVGRDYRVVDLADFYLYPTDAVSIHQAIGVMERRLLTEDELLRGADNGDFDAEVVADLLAAGPTEDWQGNEFTEQRREREGLDEGGEGFYTCYEYFGYLPLLREGGEIALPEEAISVDVRAVICPGHREALHLDFSAYPGRPYLSTSMLCIPGRFLGKGLCQLVNELQEEATANLRAGIDGTNLTMTPSLFATPEWIAKNAGKWRIRPGGHIPRGKPGDVEPVIWPQTALEGLQLSQIARERAQAMVSSQNYGTMPSKQRRVIEVQNVLQATDQKFSLYRMPMEWFFCELAAWMVALELTFGEGSEQFARVGTQKTTVFPEDLEGKYLYSTSVTRMISDPSTLYQIVLAKVTAQIGYLKGSLELAGGNPAITKLLWHGARQTILELDPSERNIENWIGAEPQIPEAPALPAPPMENTLIPGMGIKQAGGLPGGGGAQGAGMLDLMSLMGVGNGTAGNGAGGMGGV